MSVPQASNAQISYFEALAEGAGYHHYDGWQAAMRQFGLTDVRDYRWLPKADMSRLITALKNGELKPPA